MLNPSSFLPARINLLPDWLHLRTGQYRPDIDGLRAVAVLSIVGFHAFPEFLEGGFVGVDVFFVISGYLITTIILRELKNRDFSLLNFYVRRVRRILPSLIVVLVFCYIFGWLALLPDEFEQLGKHIAAGSVFIINFVLWNEAGYFDTASELKPLLHLWSLAIEEQFYICFPLLLILSSKKKYGLLIIIVSLALLSFVTNIALVDSYPISTFFLPHTRIWELLVGSILAYASVNGWIFSISKAGESQIGITLFARPIAIPSWASEAAAWAGLLLIILAVFAIEKDDPFPGFWALLPTCGTLLVILAGSTTWLNRTILSSGPLVFIGLVSFPFYLWHWPILSFARLIQSTEPQLQIRIYLVIASFILASLTYWTVEKPIRKRIPTLVSTGIIIFFLITTACLGYRVVLLNGLPSRMAEQLTQYLQAKESASDSKIAAHLIVNKCSVPNNLSGEGYWCQSDKREYPSFALIGDSHAISFYHGLVVESNPGQRWELIGKLGCSFVSGGIMTNIEDPFQCNDFSQKAIDALVRDSKIVGVLFVLADRELNRQYFSINPQDRELSLYQLYLAGLSRTFRTLEEAGKQIFFFIDNPWIVIDPKPCLVTRLLFWIQNNAHCSITRLEHEKKLASFRKLANELKVLHPKLIIFDPTNLYCDSERCNVVRDGKSLYSQTDHLSDFASRMVATEFFSFLNMHLSTPSQTPNR